MRSIIAGEVERLEAAKQYERKLIKREWLANPTRTIFSMKSPLLDPISPIWTLNTLQVRN